MRGEIGVPKIYLSLHGRPKYNISGEHKAVIGAASWTVAERVFSQLAQLTLFIVAIRVLSPAAFGIFALIQALVFYLSATASTGWKEFILGWRGDKRALSQAIGLALATGGILCGLTQLSLFPLSRLFENKEIITLAQLLSIQILLQPLGVAYQAILLRRGDTRSAALTEIAASTAGLVTGLAALSAGLGVIALGISQLVHALCFVLCIIAAARWRKNIILIGPYARHIFNIQKQVFLPTQADAVSRSSGVLIVGYFLGAANAAYFRAAERAISVIGDLVFEPIRISAWMVFRKAAANTDDINVIRGEIEKRAAEFFPIIFFVACPILVGLAIIADDIISVLLTEHWKEAGQIISILTLSMLFSLPSIVTTPLLTIAGKVEELPPYQLLTVAIGLIAMILLTPLGLAGAAFAKVVAGFASLVIAVILQSKYASANWLSVVPRISVIYPALTALVGAVLVTRIIAADMPPTVIWLVLGEIAMGAIAYLGIMSILKPGLFPLFRNRLQ